MTVANHDSTSNKSGDKGQYYEFARKFANYVGVVGGIAFFIIGFLIDIVVNGGKHVDLISLISVIFGLVLDRLIAITEKYDETIEGRARFQEVRNSFSRLENQIQSTSSVQFVGTADTASDQIISELLLARRVRNTFVNVGGSKSTFPIAHSQIVDAYQQFLTENKENVWQDIVSVNELFSPRFSEIEVSGTEVGRHTIGVLRQNMPLINFVLVAKPNESFSEVYFGWLYDESSRTSYIYRSRDLKLVETFRTYFDILWREKTFEHIDVDYTKQKREKLWRSSTVDKVGRWLTIAFKNRQIEEAETYGLIDVEFVDTKPFISGVIYSKLYRKTSIVNPRSAVHTGNKLYCEYANQYDSNRIGGMFVYEFKKHSKLDIIHGFIVDDSSGSRIELLGLRLQDKYADADFTDAKIVQTVVEENQDLIKDLSIFYGYQNETDSQPEQMLQRRIA